MVAGTTPRALLAVIVGMTVLWTTTSFLVRAWRAGRYDRAEDHFKLGKQFAHAGKNEEAAEQYRAALSFSPGDSNFRLELALALMNLGRLDEAEAHLAELKDADPTNAVVNLALARIGKRQSKWNDAVLHYHRAIFGFWPEQPERNRIQARFELVSLLSDRGRQKEALAELLELAGEAPNDPDLQKRVANLVLANGAPRSAADIFQAIVNNSPDDAAAWHGLGETQFQQGEYVSARTSFHRALRRNPKDDQARHRAAECDQIVALDPTLPKLTSRQRFNRAKGLLLRTEGGLGQCLMASGATDPKGPPDPSQSMKALLQATSRRRSEEDALKLLNAAQERWKSWEGLCPAAAQSDEPLALVMGKVSN